MTQLGPHRAWRGAPSAAVALGFAIAGLGISVYLTVIHYASVPPVCSTTGVIDCAAVTTSSYSLVPATDVPVTVPGMAWFLVSGGLALLALLRVRTDDEPSWLRPAHLGWAALGLVAVLYLIWAEAVRLHRLCEWCTGVHLLVVGTLLVTVWRWQQIPPGPP